MNVRVGRIARRQAIMGGFAPEASPLLLPVASDSDSEDKDDDDGADDYALALPLYR